MAIQWTSKCNGKLARTNILLFVNERSAETSREPFRHILVGRSTGEAIGSESDDAAAVICLSSMMTSAGRLPVPENSRFIVRDPWDVWRGMSSGRV